MVLNPSSLLGLSLVALVAVACEQDEPVETRARVMDEAAYRKQLGQAPGIPPVFNGVRFGQTPEQVKKALPGLKRTGSDHRLRWDDFDGRPGPSPFISVRVEFDYRKPLPVDALGVSFENLEHAKILDQLWGPPLLIGTDPSQERIWFNPKARIRASLERHELTYEQYLPLSDLLGQGPAFAFEKGPILSRTPQEIRKHYPEAFVGKRRPDRGEPGEVTYLDFGLPPTELGQFSTPIKVPIVHGKAAAIWFEIPTRKSKAHRQRIIAYLVEHFAIVPSKVIVAKTFAALEESHTLAAAGEVWEAEQKGRFIVALESDEKVVLFVLPKRTDRIDLDVIFEKLP